MSKIIVKKDQLLFILFCIKLVLLFSFILVLKFQEFKFLNHLALSFFIIKNWVLKLSYYGPDFGFTWHLKINFKEVGLELCPLEGTDRLDRENILVLGFT